MDYNKIFEKENKRVKAKIRKSINNYKPDREFVSFEIKINEQGLRYLVCELEGFIAESSGNYDEINFEPKKDFDADSANIEIIFDDKIGVGGEEKDFDYKEHLFVKVISDNKFEIRGDKKGLTFLLEKLKDFAEKKRYSDKNIYVSPEVMTIDLYSDNNEATYINIDLIGKSKIFDYKKTLTEGNFEGGHLFACVNSSDSVEIEGDKEGLTYFACKLLDLLASDTEINEKTLELENCMQPDSASLVFTCDEGKSCPTFEEGNFDYKKLLEEADADEKSNGGYPLIKVIDNKRISIEGDKQCLVYFASRVVEFIEEDCIDDFAELYFDQWINKECNVTLLIFYTNKW